MIGSRKTAAVSESTASAKAATSPYGTCDTPGVIGSNGVLLLCWPVSASAPIVRPWNASSAAMIFGRPVRRAILNAASLASAPELQNSTRPGVPSSSSSRSAKANGGSVM